MVRQWTEEERRKQAEAVKRWKPWEKSTGPKSRAGKDRAKMNALKHGNYALSRQALRLALQLNRDFLKQVALWVALDEREALLRNEVLKNADKTKD